jgi:squamous cell carcinoma antigen recognized by T-cells 3
MEVDDDPPSIGVAMPPPSARPQPAATAQKAEAQQQQLQMLEDPAVTALRAAVAANPASYEAHLSLVQTLRAAEEAGTSTAAAAVAHAREAREAFAAAFPLSPELWAEWIADETAAAQKDQLYCKGLYERAFKDYQCAALWPGYLALLESLCDAEVSCVLTYHEAFAVFAAGVLSHSLHARIQQCVYH